MRIAIVDDLGTERTLLKERLVRQLSQRGADAEILEFDSGEAFLAAEEAQRFTAAFLDIYMEQTQTAFWFLPPPRQTMHSRGFRYGHFIIWSSPFQRPSCPVCWMKCSQNSPARSRF